MKAIILIILCLFVSFGFSQSTETYNISQTENNKVNTGKLSLQLDTLSITPNYINFSVTATKIIIRYNEELSGSEQTKLDNCISSHDGEPIVPAGYNQEEYFISPDNIRWKMYIDALGTLKVQDGKGCGHPDWEANFSGVARDYNAEIPRYVTLP